MNKKQLLDEYKKQEDKILLSQILDDYESCKVKGKIEYTNFLDMYQSVLVKNFLKKLDIKNYIFYGGYENAERKVVIFYPPEDQEYLEKTYFNIYKIIRISLSNQEKGKYTHRNYLGGIVKLGMKREKVGDILVFDDGADIIVKEEVAEVLKNELSTLKRFENSKIEIFQINELRTPEVRKEEINIIVSSLRLDNIVSDLAKTSRAKAVQIINQERVFVNGQNETKQSKNIKINDIITIRGKGRFMIKGIAGETRSGRTVLIKEKYVKKEKQKSSFFS